MGDEDADPLKIPPPAVAGETLRLPSTDPAASPQPKIGSYEVKGVVAQGGMGIVYRVHDSKLGRDVALKMLIGGSWSDPETHKRFLREAHLMAELAHPGIVPVHDMGVADGAPYYTMDLVEGARLDQYAQDRKLPLADRLRLFAQICEAVHHAHRKGVIHRDLKPANILVTHGGAPSILDFGIAHLAQPEGLREALTMSGVVMGTPLYMAPEQAQGHASRIDVRTDVYSLGVILYELVTGKLPYEGAETFALLKAVIEEEPRKPSTWMKRLSPDLEAVILKAIAKEQDRRYESAHALSEDLRNYLEGRPVAAVPDTAAYRLRKWTRRHRELAASLACAASVLLAGGSWAVWKIYRAKEEAVRGWGQADEARRDAERKTAALESEMEIGRLLAMAENKSPHDAGVIYRGILAKYPGHAMTRCRVAWMSGLRDCPKALECFEEILRSDPGFVPALEGKAKMLLRLGRDREAEAVLREAIRANPDQLGANHFIRRLLAEKSSGTFPLLGIRILCEGAEKPSEVFGIDYNSSGLQNVSREKQAEVLALFDVILEKEPRNARCLLERANLLTRMDRLEEAEETVDRALSFEPKDRPSLLDKAGLCERLGKLEEALARYRSLAQGFQSFDYMKVAEGRVLEKLGRDEEAAALCRSLVKPYKDRVQRMKSLRREMPRTVRRLESEGE